MLGWPQAYRSVQAPARHHQPAKLVQRQMADDQLKQVVAQLRERAGLLHECACGGGPLLSGCGTTRRAR